ncbi:hypothetical protein [uncultured Porphyromonas sp.]|uniref:hypothetical protein n=1 Tax=uncultured Porphyromonas sp. TaxID=159274 RepID=UPI002636F99A|nr:hypothetical protein [uncultured Porphyromonas sp.]
MKRHEDGTPTDKQRRSMQYSEDRFTLLDTIREIVRDELDRRGVAPMGQASRGQLPEEGTETKGLDPPPSTPPPSSDS